MFIRQENIGLESQKDFGLRIRMDLRPCCTLTPPLGSTELLTPYNLVR